MSTTSRAKGRPTESVLREIRSDEASEDAAPTQGAPSNETPKLRPHSDVARPERRLLAWLEDLSKKWGAERLRILVQKKGRVANTMGAVPRNMHRVANQTRLVLELIDDFRDGTYRQISWRSIAMLVTALLYSVSPADVLPDGIPFVGQLDDLALVAVVTRLVQGDLRKYCHFKGYEEREYFRTASAA